MTKTDYPTIGISFGLAPIYEIVKNREYLKEKTDLDLFIIPINTEAESLQLATNLENILSSIKKN